MEAEGDQRIVGGVVLLSGSGEHGLRHARSASRARVAGVCEEGRGRCGPPEDDYVHREAAVVAF